MDRWDVVISGGGIAGLSAAAAFGSAGFRTLCVDPAPAATEDDDPAADLRTTAILQPGARVLDRAGVWPRLEPLGTPLRVMRLVDAGGADPQPRVTRDFDAAETGAPAFGWNLPNRLIRRALLARLADLACVSLCRGVGTAAVLTRCAEARVTLTDGSRHAARLLVAADGRDSPVRRALGIPVTTLRYGQKAIVLAVTHPVPHDLVSTEVHRTGGPFTLVPLPDHAGRPASSVVWMDRAEAVERLMALDDAAFAAAASERSAHVMGPLTPVTRRQAWPIITQIAARMTAERTALMAEAAHVVPPIGAQGLNMSLADLAALIDLATADPTGLGAAPMLDAYRRRRQPDVAARVAGVDALNRAALAGAQPLRDLRAAGLRALHGVTPVRRGLMRLGLG